MSVVVEAQLTTKPHAAAHSLSPAGMRERIGRVKGKKLKG